MSKIVKLLIATGLVLLIVGAAFAIFSSKSSSDESEDLKTVQSQISRHYLLPKAEVPALATITDPSKVTTEFLRDTKAGDKILIYQEAQLVIVYRPSIDRVVKVGPVQIAPLKTEQQQL